MRLFKSDDGAATLVRIPEGDDLLEGLTRAVTELGIQAGWVQVLGAAKKVVVGYYDQTAKEYRTHEPEGTFEIASGVASISMKDGEPFVHLHLTCSGEDGTAIGGHAMPGTIVFVAECFITELRGPAPERVMDESTGLALWPA